MQKNNLRILLSRTDSIGDVVLTLPMAGLIKKHLPHATIYFLDRTYTKDVVSLSEHIDGFVNYDDIEKQTELHQIEAISKLQMDVIIHVFPNKQIASLAKKSGIGLRVGTTNRLFHWNTCNKLVRLSRKNSNLHESQLNMRLLEFLNFPIEVSLSNMYLLYGFTKIPQLTNSYTDLIDKTKYNLILHPKSKGSAKEWGLANFQKLINQLPPDRYKIFISGTEQDGHQMQPFLEQNKGVINLTGKLNLSQFISFIHACDALVAASTGPLHIAAALGKNAIGLFSPKRPIHPGRWMPIGKNAHYLVFDKDCINCAKGKECQCIQQINPQQIVDLLIK
jgi:heptosyltransferase III